MGTSKAGRKRKLNVERNRDGSVKRKCLNDGGNDFVQARRERFACFRDGKAHEHLGDSIGRAWAAGLLEGTAYDSALLRDTGRDYDRLYWAVYPHSAGVGSYEPRDKTTGSGDFTDPDPTGERFGKLDRLVRRLVQPIYQALQDLTVNRMIATDDDPAWLDRLINEQMIFARGSLVRCRYSPTMADREMLELAKAGLVAMIG